MRPLIKTIQAALFVALLAGTLSTGAGCGGGKVMQTTSSKTLGEELQDLQESYDKGIITKQQYDDTKKKLIKKYTD